jgi:predicted enzyme related to lactoylglutathione lyase
MGKITGLGGPFIKVKDPKALAAWYQEKLGINFNGNVYTELPFAGSGGYNLISFFKADSNYFAPSTSPIMINLRVEGLIDFLEELKSKGVELVGDPMDEEYGKFAWILDLEGNKIELWEPPV